MTATEDDPIVEFGDLPEHLEPAPPRPTLDEILAALRERPGEWAIIGEFGFCYIDNKLIAPLREAGCEVRLDRQEGDIFFGRGDIWAVWPANAEAAS